jgi:hypothetical protein
MVSMGEQERNNTEKYCQDKMEPQYRDNNFHERRSLVSKVTRSSQK